MSLERREEPEEQTVIDQRFAEIIAQLQAEESVWDPPEIPAARAEETTADPPPADSEHRTSTNEATPPEQPALPPASAGLPTQWRMPADGENSFLEAEDDGTYEPPPPRPLPGGDDIGFWAMIACLVGGPLWLLYLLFFDRETQSLWWVLACLLFVAGVVQLVMRSPKNRDDQDEDDDGAVL